jgi:hypothetical protein
MFSLCSPQVKSPKMTDDPQGDGYTLGLLVDLRDLCTKIGDNHYRMAAELHDLLREVANPNVHGLDKELSFRVQQTASGEYAQRQCRDSARGFSSRGAMLSTRALAPVMGRLHCRKVRTAK